MGSDRAANLTAADLDTAARLEAAGFRVFPNYETASAWLTRFADRFIPRLAHWEREAIAFYRYGINYQSINGFLRGDLPDYLGPTMRLALEMLPRVMPYLDAAIQKGVVTERVTAVRSWGYYSLAHLEPGDEFTDAGYLSMSLRFDWREFTAEQAERGRFSGRLSGGHFANIRIPAGARAIGVRLLKLYADRECELILPRGSRFFVVEKPAPENGGRFLFDLLI